MSKLVKLDIKSGLKCGIQKFQYKVNAKFHIGGQFQRHGCDIFSPKFILNVLSESSLMINEHKYCIGFKGRPCFVDIKS